MRFTSFIAALVLPVLAVSAQSKTITVIVGGNSSLTFNPSSVTAAVGDTIAFQFQSKNHTVTQSTFANPCTQMTTPVEGIDSGFQPVAANATSFPQYSFTMTNASAPLWFYCKQTGHCGKGMVFAVNPTANKTFAAFQAAAEASGATASGSTYGSPAATGATGATPGASGTGAASPSASAKSSGALRVGGSAAGVLTVVGLVAGLAL
ncbi:hypothetical protein JAAARDRAFT_31912 [Jaapia argillacea MUCL 33604]|uniref:Phytocyanin domain-containing protein n=1 Tax=Jaapia argillacea MUCL 33604 TaxID=933084 RepID=A0A067Q1G8_9AGAM|nr:hypothetical protein JAAARDRAFT_31912 [Jaapia argillacea MUCL 33604]